MAFLRVTNSQEKWVKHSFTEDDMQFRVFDECEFNNCSFIGFKFEECRFLNCKFTECDLSNIIPMNCHFIEVRFTKCKAIGIDWTKTEKIIKMSFSECLLNYSNFRLLKLPEIKMVKCEVKEVDFIETDLSDGDFKNTDFNQSIFFKTNLTNADFKGATNYSIDFTTNTLKQTRFSLPEAISLLNNSDIIIE
ncbi:pentapeptide repeat-containing protein [Chloroflexota bacterium]